MRQMPGRRRPQPGDGRLEIGRLRRRQHGVDVRLVEGAQPFVALLAPAGDGVADQDVGEEHAQGGEARLEEDNTGSRERGPTAGTSVRAPDQKCWTRSSVIRVSWRSPVRHWCSTPSAERRQRAQIDPHAAGDRVGPEPPEPIDRQDVEALVAAGVGRRQRQPPRRLPAADDRAGIVAGAPADRQELRLAAVVAQRQRHVVVEVDADRRRDDPDARAERSRGSGRRPPAGSGRPRTRARRRDRRGRRAASRARRARAPRLSTCRPSRHSTPPPARVSSKPARACHWTRPKTRSVSSRWTSTSASTIEAPGMPSPDASRATPTWARWATMRRVRSRTMATSSSSGLRVWAASRAT